MGGMRRDLSSVISHVSWITLLLMYRSLCGLRPIEKEISVASMFIRLKFHFLRAFLSFFLLIFNERAAFRQLLVRPLQVLTASRPHVEDGGGGQKKVEIKRSTAHFSDFFENSVGPEGERGGEGGGGKCGEKNDPFCDMHFSENLSISIGSFSLISKTGSVSDDREVQLKVHSSVKSQDTTTLRRLSDQSATGLKQKINLLFCKKINKSFLFRLQKRVPHERCHFPKNDRRFKSSISVSDKV